MTITKFKPLLKRFLPLYHSKGLRNIVLVGGRYSAKSWAIAEAIVYYMTKYRVRVLCTRMVQMSIDKSSKQVIADTIHRYGLDDSFTITRDRITHNTTGATCWFIGMHDTNSIRSLEGIDICWVEEAQACTEEASESLIPTIRKANAVMFWSLNPIYETDWVCKSFLGSTPPPDTVVIRVNYNDLPEGVIDPAILKLIKHEESQNPAKYRHIYLGEFADSTAGCLFPMSLIRESMLRQPGVAKGERIVGVDIGGGGDQSTVVCRQGDVIHYVHSIDLDDPQQLGIKIASYIKDEPLGTMVCVDAGGIGWGIPAILRGILGNRVNIIPVMFGSGPLSVTSKALNRRSEMYMAIADHMRLGLSIMGCPSDLSEELAVIKAWETVAGKLQLDSKDDIRKVLGRSTDYSDALALTYAVKTTQREVKFVNKYDNNSYSSDSWMN